MSCVVVVVKGEVGRHEPKPVLSFLVVCAAYRTVKSFCCAHSTGSCDEENILTANKHWFVRNVWLQCVAATKHLSVMGFFDEEVICMQALK